MYIEGWCASNDGGKRNLSLDDDGPQRPPRGDKDALQGSPGRCRSRLVFMAEALEASQAGLGLRLPRLRVHPYPLLHEGDFSSTCCF